MTGYTAKCACSQYFVNGRPIAEIEQEDFDLSVLQYASVSVDDAKEKIESNVLGLFTSTAKYESGIGCRLIHGKDDYRISFDRPKPTPLSDTIDWPYGSRDIHELPKGVDQRHVDQIIDYAFDAERKMIDKRTRSLLVVYRDTIIAEAYQEGFDKDTPILGWSMTKSWMNTLIGILVKDSIINISDDHLTDQWRDQRSALTLHHLLTMTSGIAWEEEYDKVSDATEMLYKAEDIVAVASDNPLAYSPGEHWYYSSGTSNLISGIIRNQFADHESYLRFPFDRFFYPLGMHHAYMETDEAGNYIGSSYGYASTRDWAKFGLLYLHDGLWHGQRILPSGWVDYSRRSTSTSKGEYGAHFWLNIGGVQYPRAPEDTYSANGYQGQKVIIIPSKELVIVRTGLNSCFDFDELIQLTLKAIPQ